MPLLSDKLQFLLTLMSLFLYSKPSPTDQLTVHRCLTNEAPFKGCHYSPISFSYSSHKPLPLLKALPGYPHCTPFASLMKHHLSSPNPGLKASMMLSPHGYHFQHTSLSFIVTKARKYKIRLPLYSNIILCTVDELYTPLSH